MKSHKTIGRCFLFAMLVCCTLRVTADDDTNLYYRVFALGGSIDRCDPYFPPGNTDMKAELSAKDQKITWPPGSMAMMVTESSWHLIARNTNENLHRIAAVSQPVLGTQLSFESSILGFKKDDIEKLNAGEGVSKKTLFDLRQKGRSKLISTAYAVTQAGQEANVRNVRQIIYPCEELINADTNESCNPRIVVPETFSTLEVGTILQVVPELDEGGRFIKIILKSEWSTLKAWETHEVVTGIGDELKKSSVRMPVMDLSTVETSLRIEPGDAILLGGGKDVDSDWIYYTFLKAEILRPTRPQQILKPKSKE